MRYSDEELFDLDTNGLNSLKNQLNFNDFCEWAEERLQWLIKDSTEYDNWMSGYTNHLRNYRIKSIGFYEKKKGNK